MIRLTAPISDNLLFRGNMWKSGHDESLPFQRNRFIYHAATLSMYMQIVSSLQISLGKRCVQDAASMKKGGNKQFDVAHHHPIPVISKSSEDPRLIRHLSNAR